MHKMFRAHENPIIVLDEVIIKNVFLELGKKIIMRVGELKKNSLRPQHQYRPTLYLRKSEILSF